VSIVAKETTSNTCSSDWQRRYLHAVRILAGFEFILILATWPLWWRNGAFPAIPLVDSLALPLFADRTVVCILLATCALIAGASGIGQWDKTVRTVSLVAALVLCVTSQQRVQAWHWLFVLGLSTSLFRPEHGMPLLRSILASVYVCSALSRLAPTAHQGMSAVIVDQLLVMSGIRMPMSDAGLPELLCQALNIGEFIVGVMLIWPGLRGWGILCAMALHVTLLVALGPFGLRHNNAVLIWNLCCFCVIPVAFSGPVADVSSGVTGQCRFYQAATLLVWLFPLSGLIGVADNWPAWQLYSTRPESWTLKIREADIRDLDEDIRPYVSAPAPLEDWAVVRLDRWSLAATHSPLYPEDRFQCKLIRLVLATLPDGAEFCVEISEPKRWFWWNRNHRTLTARDELNAD